VPRKQSHHDVNVIGHDAPYEQAVTLFIKVTKGGSEFLSDQRIPQMTGACASVEVLFNDWGRKALDLLRFVGAEFAM